jgi:hypothetical protein
MIMICRGSRLAWVYKSEDVWILNGGELEKRCEHPRI